jgi:hypothetical protein
VKNPEGGGLVERVYLEAILMGLCVGLAALALNSWVGDGSWPLRIASLLAIGGGLCLVQYWLARVGRG